MVDMSILAGYVLEIRKLKNAAPKPLSKGHTIPYVYGERLGDRDCIYMHDTEEKNSPRKAYFICGECGKKYIAPVKKVKTNHVCSECGHKNTGLKRRNQFVKGQILNQCGSIFIEDLGIDGYGHYGIVECGLCHQKYRANLHHVVNRNQACPNCKGSRIIEIKTKYHSGDIITLKNGNIFKFLEETTKETDVSRRGQFVLLDTNFNPVGKPFHSTLPSILYGYANGRSMSIGESKFYNALMTLGIDFEPQRTFEGLVGDSGTKLRFDFYLCINNKRICIELDGIQHYQPVERFGGEKEFIRVQKYDKRKDDYCEIHGIKLIRIPYTEYDKINQEYVKNLLEGVLENR